MVALFDHDWAEIQSEASFVFRAVDSDLAVVAIVLFVVVEPDSRSFDSIILRRMRLREFLDGISRIDEAVLLL